MAPVWLIVATLFVSGVALAQPPGSAEHAEARRLLDAGEGAAAVESAFEALLLSEEFDPAAWSEQAPEGGIVLDEFTGAATVSYRRSRANYRLTLGDALLAAGDPEGAEVEFQRSAALAPNPETWRRLADLPGLDPAARVEFLLRSWEAAQGDAQATRELLELLPETGVFRTEAGLAATLDRFRFRTAGAFRSGIPEGLAPEPTTFPQLTLAVEGGAWTSARSFGEGRSVLLYYPAPGCGGCGEVIGDLQIALRDRAVDLLAAVPDSDLAILLRIAELTGAGLFQPEPHTASARSALAPRPVAHVVRRDTVDFAPAATVASADADDAETDDVLWLAARSGLSVWRISLAGGVSVRRIVDSLFRFLGDSPVPGGQQPLVEIPDRPEGLIETLRVLETGDEPIADLEERLLGMTRTTLREADDPATRATELLEAAAPLRAGDAARLRLLTELVPRFGDRLLQTAQELDGTGEQEVIRAVPGGRLRVAQASGVAPGAFAVQREYQTRGGATAVLSALVRPGDPGDIHGLSLDPGRADSVTPTSDGFLFVRTQQSEPGEETCAAWGPPEGPLTERCSAEISRGTVFTRASQTVTNQGELTDPTAPDYRIRVDGGPNPPEADALTEGITAFTQGNLDGAEAAFRRAMEASGPGSPIARAALRYNLAMVEEARGNREAAIAILQTIGDATFPNTIEEAIRRLYRTPPQLTAGHAERLPVSGCARTPA